ncbi:unnamed protein product [Lymnaea stagnalis]|uniref:Uncharacterized protein n=1 Tax=Lymnaea stagnalis TaxID=6523 RepID=A0AAV2HNL9_LYMST
MELALYNGGHPWNNPALRTMKRELCGTIETKDSKFLISGTRCSAIKPFICEYHAITARPSVNPTTPEMPIQDSGANTDMVSFTTLNRKQTEVSTTNPSGWIATITSTATPRADAEAPTTSEVPSTPKQTVLVGEPTKDTGAVGATSLPEQKKDPRIDGERSESPATSALPLTSTTAAVTLTSTTAAVTLTSTTAAVTLTSTSSESFLASSSGKHVIDKEGNHTKNSSTGTGMVKPRPTHVSTVKSTITAAPLTMTSAPPATTRTTPATTRPTPAPTRARGTTTPTASATPDPPGPAGHVESFKEDDYNAYKGCYVPGTGSSLMNIVLTAQSFYRKDSRTCPAVSIGSIDWPATEAGRTARVKCQSGDGYATWLCGESPLCWANQPNVTSCASKKIQALLKKFISLPSSNSSTGTGPTQTVPPPTVAESIQLTSLLAEATETETTMEDVLLTSQVMTELTQKLDNAPIKNTKQIRQIVDNVVMAGSNLVSSNKSAMWEDMTQNDKVRSASSLLVAMETATLTMAEEITEPTVIRSKDENIDLELHVVDVHKLNKSELVYGTESSAASVSIPAETLKSLSDGNLAKAVFMTHYSMSDILGGQEKAKKKTKMTSPDKEDPAPVEGDAGNTVEAADEKETRPHIASYILSASVGTDGHIRKLPQPISFTMKHIEDVLKGQIPYCSFWNTSERLQLGFWSQKGCNMTQTNATHTTCQCDHMTHFAILLDVYGLNRSHFQYGEVHESLLTLVSIIGCVISSTALFASWITFQCFISLQGERNSIHKNLAVCLFVTEIIFVSGISQTQYPVLCSVIAGFLHYFLMAAFTWMFLEGLHIIFMLVQVFDSSRSRVPYYYLTGYGVPLIIVSASCLFNYRGYGTEKFCWLSVEHYFMWAVAGPVAIILLVNALFLTYAMSTVCRHSDYVFSSKDKTTGGGIRSWVQGAFALEILLGLTWTVGYFIINESSVPLAYIFAVLNSLQGLFIFLFHCLLNKKAQKEYRSVVHTMVSRSSSSAGSHSTLTKRTNHHSHEMNHSHQKLNNTNSHSLA